MDYIDRIKNAREEKGISQRQFSKMLGLSETTYSPYERRQRKMDVDMLIQICQLLDLSADEILGLK
ncbi:MAG TPA: helix-turn-helix transcriptional regulator [Candidatus Agathobaculum stercoravium]|nr:helix-turn-helix transcriptional regulator [uncultured Agathobaculum sp.]HIV96402.1 helix-turn-helix transcriptional regulator [Candidatus Agathobaculum stercoravium]